VIVYLDMLLFRNNRTLSADLRTQGGTSEYNDGYDEQITFDKKILGPPKQILIFRGIPISMAAH